MFVITDTSKLCACVMFSHDSTCNNLCAGVMFSQDSTCNKLRVPCFCLLMTGDLLCNNPTLPLFIRLLLVLQCIIMPALCSTMYEY